MAMAIAWASVSQELQGKSLDLARGHLVERVAGCSPLSLGLARARRDEGRLGPSGYYVA